MHKLTFTLKQHTPIIHFQHNQPDATLRATEVKPKLDDFLRKKLKEKIRKEWKVPNQEALDYKLKIKCGSKPDEEEIASNYSLFFGNTGGKNYHVISSPKCQMTILSWHSHLITKIENYLCDFFNEHNFGMRQSKGFGSFYPDPQDQLFNRIKYKQPSSKWPAFTIQTNNAKSVFSQLELFYSSLRSGINLVSGFEDFEYSEEKNASSSETFLVVHSKSKFFFKSLLFKYLSEYHHLQWDKKTIKQEFLNPIGQDFCKRGRKINLKNEERIIKRKLVFHKDDPLDWNYVYQSANNRQEDLYPDGPAGFKQNKEKEKYLFRDYFGLSTQESWFHYGLSLSKENDVISRFKSPILFKIFKETETSFKVFLHILAIPERLRKAQFKIQMDRKELDLNMYPDFDFAHFFSWAFDESKFNIELHVDKSMQGHENYTVLKCIYDQLQKPNHA